ncbi:MAG: YkgJ family cysteine cluster protein [Simkaniaceae bacterium]
MKKQKVNPEAHSELLNDLLEDAAEASQPPPLPAGGIPKRFLPSWVGFALKGIALPFVLIDFAMQKVARKIIRPPFKRVGACKRRGNCCHYVLIAYSPKLIGRLFYFWYTQVHGFYKRLPEPHLYEGKPMHVMGCRYLKKDGSCQQYRLRPLICRLWPVVEHFGYPKILKGCGYSSIPPYPFSAPEDHLSEGQAKLNVLD